MHIYACVYIYTHISQTVTSDGDGQRQPTSAKG